MQKSSQRRDNRHPIRKFLTLVVEWLDARFSSEEIRVTEYTVISHKIPKSFDGYRILQITDLHDRWFGEAQWPLVQAAQCCRPDVIVLTGDLIRDEYGAEAQAHIQPLVERLCRMAPVYAVEGNHECRSEDNEAVVEDLRRMGVQVLRDQITELIRDNQRIALVGLRAEIDNPLKIKPGLDLELVQKGKKLRAESSAEYAILLAHCPEKIESYSRMGVGLVISGHVHGGLVRLPGGRALLAPGQGWLPHYHYGLYTKGDTLMQVSCGLGGPRIGIPPEIVCITLRKKEN